MIDSVRRTSPGWKRRRARAAAVALASGTALALCITAAPASAARTALAPSGDVVATGSGGAELSEKTQLSNRRFVVTGDRAYEVGAADGTYPGTGWHIRGEMGGFWSPPIKLLDGLWFAVGGKWLKATRFTTGEGYTRMDMVAGNGATVRRLDVVPDGGRATLVGLNLPGAAGGGTSQVELTVDAHSELLSAYPWGWTTPSQAQFNLPDSGSFDGHNLVFRDTGTPPVPGAPAHDWAAMVGSTLAPSAATLGPAFRGPQGDVVCGDPQPAVCDDGPYGKGTGGRMTYPVTVPAGGRTVWFAVAGSDAGPGQAQAELTQALRDPAGAAAAKLAARQQIAAQSKVDLPGNPLLARSVEWSKQNVADSVQEARNLRVFPSNQGSQYPPPSGTVAVARWMGAGWPDYPWLFATDGEYSAFPAVAAGQFDAVKSHLTALRDVSDITNHRSGKVVHEVTPDGQVYYGANADPGNTDETVKFPSAVALVWRWTGDNAFRDQMYDFAVRNMRYAVALDADGDGWPEGSGNVERAGMGQEKLDVAVYTIRGLLDLADMAAAKHDVATSAWATQQARHRQQIFEKTWWYGGDAKGYADSLSDPGNVKLFQRYWTGVTPMEAVLPGSPGRSGGPGQVAGPPAPGHPLASTDHATIGLTQRERDCYTGEFGLYHTGTGPTSDPAGNKGPSCDSVVSSVQSERTVFTLGAAVMAVAEGNYGRLAQQRHYTNANARTQLDPTVWEMPGAMPEISPSPDFGSNMQHDFLSRSSVLQTWGSYGTLWPVISQQLGVAPDIGRGRLSVVPQLPSGQNRISGSNIRVGTGHVDVAVARSGSTLQVSVDAAVSCELTLGAVLPSGATVAKVQLDGHKVAYHTARTERGTEVVVEASNGTRTLTITLI